MEQASGKEIFMIDMTTREIALKLIQALYEQGLLNQETYNNILSAYSR